MKIWTTLETSRRKKSTEIVVSRNVPNDHLEELVCIGLDEKIVFVNSLCKDY